MYALVIVRYRRPIEQILPLTDAHLAYLEGLQEKGLVLVSGRLDPRFGGALLLRVPDGDALAVLDRIRDGDPFVRAGVAQYEILPWVPVIGRDALDAAFPSPAAE
jgi:uncharacterized protein YciI